MNTQQSFRKLCIDFIPILLIYVFAVYTKDAVLLSNTSLGKLLAISIIVFYTSINTVYGIFVCLLILVYYQTDFVEEILNMERGEWMENQMAEMNALISTKYGDPLTGVELNGDANGRTTIVDIGKNAGLGGVLGTTPSKHEDKRATDKLAEGFRSNDPDIYAYVPVRSPLSQAEDVLDKKDKKAELMAIFRKDHCENGILMNRGLEVNSEMSDHIFREIKFEDESKKCNPCDPSCRFSIIEEKIKVETELQTPVRSNDAFSQSLQEMYHTTTNAVSGYLPNIPSFSLFVE